MVNMRFPKQLESARRRLCLNVQHQSKVWTHLLIQGVFFIFTIFYIVE